MLTQRQMEVFWCCLAPPEKAAIEFMFTSAVPPDVTVAKFSADVVFSAIGLDTPLLRKGYFLTVWGFGEGVIEVPGIGEVEVYIWSLPQYLQLAIFKDDVGFECEEPCKQLGFYS